VPLDASGANVSINSNIDNEYCISGDGEYIIAKSGWYTITLGATLRNTDRANAVHPQIQIFLPITDRVVATGRISLNASPDGSAVYGSAYVTGTVRLNRGALIRIRGRNGGDVYGYSLTINFCG